MKALSLTQPMAWAIFHGKDVENRTWKTNFRGRVYIHASKKFDRVHYNFLISARILYLPEPCEFVHGAIIGEVDILDCRYRDPDLNANLFSRWHMPGQWGFYLANAIGYDRPIPCKGTIFPLFFEPDI